MNVGDSVMQNLTRRRAAQAWQLTLGKGKGHVDFFPFLAVNAVSQAKARSPSCPSWTDAARTYLIGLIGENRNFPDSPRTCPTFAPLLSRHVTVVWS